MADWNAATIQEFHSKAGKGIGPFGDQLMLLTTVGARSGDEHITPVMYHRDGERYVVIASKGGAPDHPGWYHNLKANPAGRVEVGAEGDERDRIYAERVAIAPGFGEYERQTSRKIPVMILERTT